MTKQEKTLDALYRVLIRKRAMWRVGGCEKCLTQKYDIVKESGKTLPAWKQLDTAHCFGRGRKSIRWDDEDAAGLCGACHMLIDGQHDIKEALFREILGDQRYDFLQIRAATPVHHQDKSGIEVYLRVKIKELEGEE